MTGYILSSKHKRESTIVNSGEIEKITMMDFLDNPGDGLLLPTPAPPAAP